MAVPYYNPNRTSPEVSQIPLAEFMTVVMLLLTMKMPVTLPALILILTTKILTFVLSRSMNDRSNNQSTSNRPHDYRFFWVNIQQQRFFSFVTKFLFYVRVEVRQCQINWMTQLIMNPSKWSTRRVGRYNYVPTLIWNTLAHTTNNNYNTNSKPKLHKRYKMLNI